jgi:hypothetical protein
MTVYQIHNVLRTYFHFFESKAVESTPKDSEGAYFHDRVTISPEARKKLEATSQSDEIDEGGGLAS